MQNSGQVRDIDKENGPHGFLKPVINQDSIPTFVAQIFAHYRVENKRLLLNNVTSSISSFIIQSICIS